MYQIDAFAQKVFEGNPAAVIPLKRWLDDEVMQKIAMENNLSETVFFVKEQEKYHIRWFTPLSEVEMCGHATLASAYVIFEELQEQKDEILFSSKSGDLYVKKVLDKITMDFPIQTLELCETPQQIVQSFGKEPLACYRAMDYVLIFEDEKDIANAKPNLQLLTSLDARGVCIAAASKRYDFVTRFFAPRYGVNEDPVTGSAFTQLVYYFHKRLNKEQFFSKQLSQRGGEIFCKLKGDRVELSGYCVKFLEATISVSQ